MVRFLIGAGIGIGSLTWSLNQRPMQVKSPIDAFGVPWLVNVSTSEVTSTYQVSGGAIIEQARSN